MAHSHLKTHYSKSQHTARLAPLPAISDGVYEYLHKQVAGLYRLAAYAALEHAKAPQDVLRNKDGRILKRHGLRVFDPENTDTTALRPHNIRIDYDAMPEPSKQLIRSWTQACNEILDARHCHDALLTWQTKTQLSSLRKSIIREVYKETIPSNLPIILDTMEKLVLHPNKISWQKQLEKHCDTLKNQGPDHPSA